MFKILCKMLKIIYKVGKLIDIRDYKSYEAKKHSTISRIHDRYRKQRYNSIISTYVQLYVCCAESSTPKQSKKYQNDILNVSTLNHN